MGIFAEKEALKKEAAPEVVEKAVEKKEAEAVAAEVKKAEAAPAAEAKVEAQPEEKAAPTALFKDEMGVVAPGTVIHGDVVTQGHLAIAGTVEGNVDCAGNLILTGAIKGDIDCSNIVLESSNVSPHLNVRGSVSIKDNIRFTGDVVCKNISVMGTVIGNIEARETVGLTKTSAVEGNINAKTLVIEPGAKIKGYVDIK